MDGTPLPLEALQGLVHTLSTVLSVSGSTALPKEPFKLDVKRLVDIFQVMVRVPSCKSAVLECFGAAYDSSVYQCLTNQDKKSGVTTQYTVADELNELLKSLLPNRGWASVLSTWCIRTLGQISSKYASFVKSVNLDEVMNFWMTCPPTKHLIEMMSDCLKNMVHDEADSCISALLETLIEYNPHFDWVVAYMGNSFPETVISRILSVGLFDFVSNHKETDVVGDGSKLAKVKSAIGIVCYLAGSHLKDVEKGIHQLYKLFNPCSSEMTEIQLGVLPFLLHISTASPFMADVIAKVVISTLTIESFESIVRNPVWITEYYGSVDDFRNILSNVIFRLDRAVFDVLNLAFSIGKSTAPSSQTVREFTSCFVAQTLKKLQSSRPSDDFPVLSSLLRPKPMEMILSNLLSSVDWLRSISFELIVLLGASYRGNSVVVQALKFVLCSSTSEEQLVVFHKLVQDLQSVHSSIVPSAIGECLSNLTQKETSQLRSKVIENLSVLMSWEKGSEGQKISSINKIATSFQKHIDILLKFLDDRTVAIQVIALLCESDLPQYMSEGLSSQIAEALLPLFFACLDIRDPLLKSEAVASVQYLLVKLCHRPAVQTLILRTLIEKASNEKLGLLLGKSDVSVFHKNHSIPLLEKNQKFSSAIAEFHRHNAVLYSGVIGKGLRATQKRNSNLSSEDIQENIVIFVETLSKCCSQSASGTMVDGMTKIAMILLELLSPDVMYNGLPWPEEDFMKVTIERDLTIKKALETQPVFWEILRILALTRPALCYCSVILRAPLGILISQWSSEQERPERLEMTCKILDLMSLGQLLPPPLTMVSEILPLISQQEATALLRDVWSYMRENVPAPALFVKDSNGNIWRDFKNYHIEPKYTDRLRLVVLSNIENLGHCYRRIVETEEDIQ